MSRKVIIHNHLPSRDVNAFEHALPREQEEKNRDEAYRRTGITRVQRDDAWSVGQKVHLGFGTRGGTGFYGTITKIDGDTVEIKSDSGKTYKGPTRLLSRA